MYVTARPQCTGPVFKPDRPQRLVGLTITHMGSCRFLQHPKTRCHFGWTSRQPFAARREMDRRCMGNGHHWAGCTTSFDRWEDRSALQYIEGWKKPSPQERAEQLGRLEGQ